MIGGLYRRGVALRTAGRRWWFFQRLRFMARIKGVELDLVIGRNVGLGKGVSVVLGGRRLHWVLGDGVALADDVSLHFVDAEVVMGAETRVKRECILQVFGGRLVFEGCGGLSQRCIVHCADEISLGKWSAVSEYTTIVDSEHVVPVTDIEQDWLRSGEVRTAPVRIGRYVLVGAKATILKGVTVGDHSIVAANSLVVKDLPPHSIGIGVPARRMRRPDAPVSDPDPKPDPDDA